MVNHKKPTKEELQEKIDNDLKDLDQPTPSEPTPSEPAPSEPAPSEPSPSEAEPTPSEPIPSETTPSESAPSEPEPTPSEPAPSPDYKEKYRHSTREAKVHQAGREALATAIETADGLPEPSDEDLAGEYKDWDVMSETEQRLAKKAYINDRRFELINKANKEASDYNSWLKRVDDFVDDPKVLSDMPDLEGKQDDFKAFASKKTRRGVPLEELVRAFLYDATKDVKPKKGKMFESPSGGPNNQPKKGPVKISIEEAKKIRVRDYGKYKELLRAGQIETNIE